MKRMKRLQLSAAFAVLSVSMLLQPASAFASFDWGGYGYNPCCYQPKYPFSYSTLYSNSLSAYNNLYDFDTLFAKKAQQSQVDKLSKFDASKRSTAADKINRISDKSLAVDRKDFAKYDQWKNVEIIRVNEGVSKVTGSADSIRKRDLNVVNDAHFRDDAAAVSSLDKTHAAQGSQAAHGATSVNQNASALNANTQNQTLNTGYSY